jgi:hypothetical protein
MIVDRVSLPQQRLSTVASADRGAEMADGGVRESHQIGQIGEAARRQDSGSLLLGQATAQAKDRISGAASWLGKDRPR